MRLLLDVGAHACTCPHQFNSVKSRLFPALSFPSRSYWARVARGTFQWLPREQRQQEQQDLLTLGGTLAQA